MGELEQKVEKIKSKEDFIEFVETLIKSLKEAPGEWENKTLEDYLLGIQSWTEDMEGYYINNNLPIPEGVNWKVFADILIAAKMYE
jgi:hypothetical protein